MCRAVLPVGGGLFLFQNVPKEGIYKPPYCTCIFSSVTPFGVWHFNISSDQVQTFKYSAVALILSNSTMCHCILCTHCTIPQLSNFMLMQQYYKSIFQSNSCQYYICWYLLILQGKGHDVMILWFNYNSKALWTWTPAKPQHLRWDCQLFTLLLLDHEVAFPWDRPCVLWLCSVLPWCRKSQIKTEFSDHL